MYYLLADVAEDLRESRHVKDYGVDELASHALGRVRAQRRLRLLAQSDVLHHGDEVVRHPSQLGRRLWRLDRAEAVRDYLSRHGVPASRIQVEGRGEREPVATNTTPQGRAMNRRVEIYLREPQKG